MKKSDLTWQWREGDVHPQKEHIELRYGDAAKTSYDEWQPVALIGKPKGRVFPVKWLIDTRIVKQKRIAVDARRQLDFYLVEQEEPDPWAYAKYHCTTGANMYSRIHWSYFPKGQGRERLSSMVIRLRAKTSRKSVGEGMSGTEGSTRHPCV